MIAYLDLTFLNSDFINRTGKFKCNTKNNIQINHFFAYSVLSGFIQIDIFFYIIAKIFEFILEA